jgi:hypothetical protein
MSDDNGTVHEPSVTYVSNDPSINPTRAYAIKGRAGFLPGNPGRLPQRQEKRKTANEIIEAFGSEPLVEKMHQLQRLKAKLARGIWKTDDEEMRCEELLHKITADIMQYRHQRLKAVESHTQIAIVQKLQAISGMSDAELDALYLEAQELAKQLPPGGS